MNNSSSARDRWLPLLLVLLAATLAATTIVTVWPPLG
jgi:hypothetical protein